MKKATSFLKTITPVSLLGLLVGLVFGQTLFFDFINYDDPLYIGVIKDLFFYHPWDAVRWAFTHIESGDWQPVTWFSWLLDKYLFGLHPMGYHLTNVILHYLVVCLLFWFLRVATGSVWKSFIMAAIFAIHPLRVESVAWVAERKDLLSAFWMMMTLIAYYRYVVSKRLRFLWYLVAFVFFCSRAFV